MNIKSDSVVGSNGVSSPNFPDGVNIGQNKLNHYGDSNFVGISTLANINSNTSISNVVYSTAYVGDASGLTGIVTTTTSSKVVALKYILSDPPLRS